MAEAIVAAEEQRRAIRRSFVRLSIVVVLMFGFGFALVPFYRAICQALGINYFIQPDAAAAVNTQVEYEIANVRDRPVTGQAVPSFGPRQAGQYFKKMECFCFAQQTLAAGETRSMPVVFVVDPAIPTDVNTITLSYTFFEVPGR